MICARSLLIVLGLTVNSNVAVASSFQGLGDLPGGFFLSQGNDVSGDGSIIVGGSDRTNSFEAFIWNSNDGIVGIGELEGGSDFSRAFGVANNSTIVGQSISTNGAEAFIWNDARGMRSLKDILIDNSDLDLTDWNLTNAIAIFQDGLTIVGNGTNSNGDREGWIATLDSDDLDDVSQTVPEPFMLWSYVIFSLGGISRRLFG